MFISKLTESFDQLLSAEYHRQFRLGVVKHSIAQGSMTAYK